MSSNNGSVLMKPTARRGHRRLRRLRAPSTACRRREVARVWSGRDAELPIKEKAVAGLDEDTASMSIEAARNALARAEIDPETHPRGLGGQRVAPLRGQADLDHRGRGAGHRAADPGGRLGVRLQGRHRGDAGRDRLRRAPAWRTMR